VHTQPAHHRPPGRLERRGHRDEGDGKRRGGIGPGDREGDGDGAQDRAQQQSGCHPGPGRLHQLAVRGLDLAPPPRLGRVLLPDPTGPDVRLRREPGRDVGEVEHTETRRAQDPGEHQGAEGLTGHQPVVAEGGDAHPGSAETAHVIGARAPSGARRSRASDRAQIVARRVSTKTEAGLSTVETTRSMGEEISTNTTIARAK